MALAGRTATEGRWAESFRSPGPRRGSGRLTPSTEDRKAAHR